MWYCTLLRCCSELEIIQWEVIKIKLPVYIQHFPSLFLRTSIYHVSSHRGCYPLFKFEIDASVWGDKLDKSNNSFKPWTNAGNHSLERESYHGCPTVPRSCKKKKKNAAKVNVREDSSPFVFQSQLECSQSFSPLYSAVRKALENEKNILSHLLCGHEWIMKL